ncbi:MAG: putative Ig domain-containing protein, partial [Clostridia bacterium]|nr:putative Ig domain-containing protein [Clostridia bacterium]
INKAQTRETDGPISLSGGFAWCVAPLQAATFNTKLLTRLGELTANQAMLRWQDSSYTNANRLAGWYGPAMNVHRSHFLGRTFEYYSEDGILGGYAAAAVVGGAQSKGLNCWIKHLVLNDQEIYRKGINTYATEQAFREIYCKPFQMPMQEGNATAIMTSFNRIGQVAASVNYNLIELMTRQEWGFDGVIVTDMYNSNCWPSAMLLRAGNDLPLGTVVPDGAWDATARSGKGSVKVTAASNFSEDKAYAVGDIVSTGVYASRKLVTTYYKFTAAKAAGVWDETKVEEVKLADIANSITFASDLQYYYVRLCAMRTLYTEANIMAGDNGYDLRKFADKTLTAVDQGVAVNQSVAYNFGSLESKYEITKGALPEGLTLAADGTVTGTAVGDAGTYKFTVRAILDKWVQKTAEMTLEVKPAFTYAEAAAATYGTAYTGALSTTTFADSSYVKAYALDGELPAGLELTETGEIVGTPTEVGTFEVTIVASVTSGKTTSKYNVPVTITVGGTVPVVKTPLELLTERVAALETSSGTTASDITAIKNDIAALKTSGNASASDIDALETRIKALEDAAAEGCGSSVASTFIVTIVLLTAALFVVRKILVSKKG